MTFDLYKDDIWLVQRRHYLIRYKDVISLLDTKTSIRKTPKKVSERERERERKREKEREERERIN